MQNLNKIFANILTYLWSGWGGAASLFLLLALWEYGHLQMGSLILPSPKQSVTALFYAIAHEDAIYDIIITCKRAFYGFGAGVLLASASGILAGTSMTVSMALRPIVTFIMGVPPIAWIVLALMWFGDDDMTAAFTVFVVVFPIIFASAMQGMRMRSAELDEMADIYQLSLWQKFFHIHMPQIISYLFPAWIVALGMSWKIVVMAELLGTEHGIGAAMAMARVNIDTAATMGWILMIIFILLMIEYLFLEPIKRYVERWKML
ncbi:MAG: ABC transporter permease subunit [OCS116 cluster bacterium]|uniref:ABC transporter permease n=1 Tax=OCS116 cluster bacterium TaxID=2030921 RepID=A0A2A4ZBM3_9PROT|nr:ABC transporter permease subunit [OCS116 cluster bacterium]